MAISILKRIVELKPFWIRTPKGKNIKTLPSG